MTYIIEMTRKDGIWFKEFEAQSNMTVAVHVQQDIRKTGFQKNDPEIQTIRYYEKGTKNYYYA